MVVNTYSNSATQTAALGEISLGGPVRSGHVLRALRRLGLSLPQGRTLPCSAWHHRHRALLALLWLHVVGLTGFALARGYSVGHAAVHGGVLALIAALASFSYDNRRLAAALVSFGLVTASALLVHTWDGTIEGHFHFFVMIALLSLYEDWLPFLLAAAYVVLHHGATGVVDPGAVYNHRDAVEHPWKWALIHGVFVLGAGAASVATWRLNEEVRAAMRATQLQLAEAQKLAELGSWEWDLGANRVTWSDELYRIFDLDPQSWQPGYDSFLERVHPDDRALVQTAVERSLATREPFEYEARIIRGSGEQRIIEAHGEPLGEVDVRVTKLVGTVQDVTERRTVEAELRSKREAEREQQAKSEFLSRVSHELRTPLNAILGFAQLLEMDDLEPGQRENVNQILKGGRHLLELINEVLEISRIETGHMNISLEPVHLGSVIAEALDLVEPLAAERGIELHSKLLGVEDHVEADKQRLKQVLLNLLSNAIKYNREAGSVTVSVERPSPERVLILVTDTGMGISEDKLARVFSPFERLGAEQSPTEGTGLGLALSKLLAEAMNGSLAVESEPWIGTTFMVGLNTAAPPSTLELAPADRDAPSRGNGRGRRVTVLYVEDNMSNFRLAERVLETRPEVRLIAAVDGNLGLELARRHRPDLILLDLHLPGATGDEVLARLKQDPLTRGIPVVVVSADATRSRIAEVMRAGAVRFLPKPLDIRQFVHELDAVLGAAGARQHA
jgi:signal transduction histidine kinase/CheY-like chemotaxis protein